MFINGKLVINNEAVECEYKENNFIKYKDDDALNIVDIKNTTYIRVNNEFIFKIEFKNKKFSYTLNENNLKLEDNLSCEFAINSNGILIKYNLDDEEKEIIIHLL